MFVCDQPSIVGLDGAFCVHVGSTLNSGSRWSILCPRVINHQKLVLIEHFVFMCDQPSIVGQDGAFCLHV